MGITIRYLVPAAAGAAFTYSVERRDDEAFFDFDLGMFRPLEDVSASAISSPLRYDNGAVTADFNHVDSGEMYTIYVHRDGQIIVKLPVTTWGVKTRVAASNGERPMEPTYRSGKKFLNGQTIEARHRLTVYGNDGFTIHTATLWEDGTSSCNCPTWGPKVDGRRRCKHSDRALTLTESIDETGERPVKPPAETPRDTNPFRRRSRSVDT